MSPASASSDNVGQVGYVIRSPNRREQRRPKRPFPEIGEGEEAEEEPADDTETPRSTKKPPPSRTDPDGEHRVDIRVAGLEPRGRRASWLRLPTGQFLPGPEVDSRIH